MQKMMRKRWLTGVLCIFLLLMLPVSAAAENDALLTMDAEENADGSFLVTLSINDGTGAEMVQFALNYDPSALELKSCSPGNVFHGTVPPTIGQEDGRIYFVWDALEPLKGGALLVMEFLPKGGASGSSEISWASDEDTVFANGDYENIVYCISPYTILIGADQGDGTVEGGQAVVKETSSPDAISDGFSDGIELDRFNAKISIGGTTTLTAGGDENLVWSSSDESVATVDSHGNVTGVGAGLAVITVENEDGTKRATCVVTVGADPAGDAPANAERRAVPWFAWFVIPLLAAAAFILVRSKKDVKKSKNTHIQRKGEK